MMNIAEIEKVKSDVDERSVSTPKLCGYLSKWSSKGGLGSLSSRKRWFSFSPQDCLLYYFQNKDDLTPLGQIDIKQATFSLEFNLQSSSYLIKIISNKKEYNLETQDEGLALHWVQSLQRLRKEYILRQDDDSSLLLDKPDDIKIEIQSTPKVSNTQSSSSVFYCNSEIDSALMDDSKLSSSSTFKEYSPASHLKVSSTNVPSPNVPSPNVKQKMINKFRLPPNHKSSSKLPSLSSCCQCKVLQSQIVNISDDLNATEKELQATREVIKVLREQLEITVNENDSLSAICKPNSSSADILQELQKRERDLTAAKVKLKQKDVNIEKLTNENQLIVNEKKKLSEQLAIMEELIQIKDATVISLTNEIFDLEKQKKAVEDSKMIKISSNELENLQDSLNAYRIQNQFLNKEIIELNELRNVSEKRQQELQLKCCEWEAKYCQIQSKLLSLLKELNQSIELQSKSEGDQAQNQLISSNNSIKVLVSRLLEESSIDIPLSWKAGNRKRNDSSNIEGDYDVLGFIIKSHSSSDEVEDTMSVKNSAYEDTGNEYSKYYRNWKSRWNTFIVQWNVNEFQKSHDFKIILRSGVPQEYRCKIWRYLINLRIKRVKDKLGRDYYQKCCNEVTYECKLKPSIKQIELDLLRTLPNNKHFESIDSIGVTRLRRVLTCYSVHNPSVGYCQGMNRLAAVALLFMPEEDAFWCLMTIVENIMPPDYFTPTLLGAHVDQYVLKDLLAEKLPYLLAHLEKHDIELSLFSWFLTCFVDNIPSRIYLRIWDVFLYEGNKVLFRFALAFLKYHAESILELNDSMAINHFLRTIGDKTKDVRKLSHIAFSLLNPFPMSTVRRKRSHYTEVVLNELGKLESLRKASPIHQPNYDSASD